MRDHFNPYADCLGPNKKSCPSTQASNPSIAWVFEAVQAIVGLAYAYDTLRNGGANIDKLMLDVGKKLDEIKDQLTQLNKGIDRIIDLLIDMPRIVRGEVNEALLAKSLGEIYQLNLLVRDSVKKEFIIQNRVRLEGHLDNIRVSLGGVIGIKGVGGALIAAPYLSVWLSASVTLQKALKAHDSNHVIQSPWESYFMDDMKTLFSDLLTQAESIDYEFSKRLIPGFPSHNRELMVSNGRFKPHPNMSLDKRYRVTCPDGTTNERLEYGYYKLSPPYPPSEHGKMAWVAVKSGDAMHQDAISAFDKFVTDRKSVVAFYSWLPKIHQRKSELLEVFTEPSNYW